MRAIILDMKEWFGTGRKILQSSMSFLTYWVRVTHICVGNLTSIASDNDSAGWRQAIIWTNAGTLFIGTLGTNFSEILSETLAFSFKKMHFKVSSAKCRPCCIGLNVLRVLKWMLLSVLGGNKLLSIIGRNIILQKSKFRSMLYWQNAEIS